MAHISKQNNIRIRQDEDKTIKSKTRYSKCN